MCMQETLVKVAERLSDLESGYLSTALHSRVHAKPGLCEDSASLPGLAGALSLVWTLLPDSSPYKYDVLRTIMVRLSST